MIIDRKKLSPMMRGYLELKDQYKDEIIFYRLGDFYEMFFDDAIKASKILNLTLTGRDCGLEEKAPMCGVPFHAAETYITKLVKVGLKVAICEQLTKPGEQKGIVKRGIVRVITPGTVIENNILRDDENNYIMSIVQDKQMMGISWMDNSTGDFYCYEFESNFMQLDNFINLIAPSEIICNDSFKQNISKSMLLQSNKYPQPYSLLDVYFDYSYSREILQDQLKVKSLEAFEIENMKRAIMASGALVKYVRDHQMQDLININSIKTINKNETMLLDNNTINNLEIFETIKDKTSKGSLLKILDKTKTPSGSRLFKKYLSMPLINSKEIKKRQDAVEAFTKNVEILNKLQEILSNIGDVERILTRLSFNAIGPRELLQLSKYIIHFQEISKILKRFKTNKYLLDLSSDIKSYNDLACEILSAIKDDAPLLSRDGGFIKEGYSEQLDSLKNVKKNMYSWLADYEKKIKEEFDIKNLKISYNRVFGYYIEVPKSQSNLLDDRFLRKQTTVNSERFTTEELTNKEIEILSSDEKVLELELTLFDSLIDIVKKELGDILLSVQSISIIDVLMSLATVAMSNNYVKPEIVESSEDLVITNGRHAVIEELIGHNNFIKNSTYLNSSTDIAMIITGPNMSGKSTYMRQVAIIVLLAHIGSFVPADYAKIPLVDRIFTRIGASDDLSKGQSTFMVEMLEIATILQNATSSSLLVIDEIGRGTSTRDGLSIAWATVEYIAKILKAKTLFSTHFHELTELEGLLGGIKNYRILVKEFADNVVFLHKIELGGASKSFGIEVADLAGVPSDIINRAKNIAKIIDENDIKRDTNRILLDNMTAIPKENQKEGSIFTEYNKEKAMEILNKIDINKTTPIEALQILTDLKDMINE